MTRSPSAFSVGDTVITHVWDASLHPKRYVDGEVTIVEVGPTNVTCYCKRTHERLVRSYRKLRRMA